MAKYRSKTRSSKKGLSATDVKEEKKFFKVAIIVTIILLVLVYFAYRNM